MLRSPVVRLKGPMATGPNFSAEDEIKHVRARLRALETEQLALRARLEELDRQRSVFEAVCKGCAVSSPFCRTRGCIPNSLGESEDRKGRIRAGVRERVGERSVQ